MRVRDHDPIVIDSFNGLWRRGRQDSCPLDHFQGCENIQFDEREIRTRDGIDTLSGPGDVVRMYKYRSPTFGESLIALDINGDFWHSTYNPDQVLGPILSIPDATDFAFEEVAGRAYISPITGIHGTSNEFLYVYQGAGVSVRKAAGFPPSNSGDKPLVAFNSSVDGVITQGIHVISIAYIDGIGGRSSALGPQLVTIYAPGDKEAIVTNIPIGGMGITGREIYMSHAIDPKDWDASATYTMYLAATISDNTSISATISIDDASLITAFAAGALAPPSDGGAMQAANSSTDGFSDRGLHVIGVVYETDTGFLTAPGPEFFAVQSFQDVTKAIDITGIPVSPSSAVTRRHLVSTIALPNYNGDQYGGQFFFIPDGTINDNVTTTKTVSYFDADLIEDASYLIDNFSEIPAGAVLSSYNGRLAIGNVDGDESIVYLSAPGEPEAIDQVDGFLTPPYRSEETTNAQEFREIFYVFKKNRTFGYVDNGDVPSSWAEPTIVDNGIGAGFHSVSTVLDSGGVNVEFLIVGHQSGVTLFTGLYVEPKLSWKIETLWLEMAGLGDDLRKYLEIYTDSINKRVWMVMPQWTMMYIDYARGLDAKNVRWTPWRADVRIRSICIFDGPRILLASDGPA